MSVAPILQVPAEIRNRIYSFCTPLFGRIEEFKGLLLTSRQIRREYESEAIKAIQHHLKSIERSWPHPQRIKFEEHTSLPGLANVTVQLPMSLYFPRAFGYPLADTRMEQCLASLFSMHLAKLFFTYYEDEEDSLDRALGMVPKGFLFDFTNTMLRSSTLSKLNKNEPQAKRNFHLENPLRIRELGYRWAAPAVQERGFATIIIQFFLREARGFRDPEGLVTNWGHDQNRVRFGIEDRGERVGGDDDGMWSAEGIFIG